MRMRDFIEKNRYELTERIRLAMKRDNISLNDSDREDWIMNDEGLYLWAKREGVRV